MSFTIINLFKMSHIGGAGGGEEIQQTLKGFWDFPGSPVVKTLPSSSGGEGLIPDQGAKSLSRVWLFVTPWTIQSMEFSRLNTGVGSLSLLQGLFPTQGSHPGLPHYRQILYQLAAMQETCLWSLGWEESLEKGMATHSSILAWRIPWTV